MSITTVLYFITAGLFFLAGFVNFSDRGPLQTSMSLALGTFFLIFAVVRWRRKDSNDT